MDEHTRINEILDELAELGKGHYKPEYKDSIPYWERVGISIASVTDYSPKSVLQLAQAVLEDHNNHNLCHVLAWAYPWLDDSGTGDYDLNKKYQVELDAIRVLINRGNVRIMTDWNPEKQEYNIHHAKVTVNVEWLD
jgi:hypothetical protein